MRVRRLTGLFLAMILLLAAGCGGPKSYGAKERFTLDKDQYALEKWERQEDKDTDSVKGYAVCLLIVGDEAPVIMGMSGGKVSSGLNMTLTSGEETISPYNISFESVKDQGDYGVRATFQFKLPKDEELPREGTLINNTSKAEAALNLSDLPGQED